MKVAESCFVSLERPPDIAAVVAYGQRLVLAEPFRFGGPDDVRMLALLGTAATHLVDIEWQLAAPPPWPVRALVHLPPPRGRSEYAGEWRAKYRFGLCTYRRGPGFVRIRDVRPDGEHVRVLVDGEWAEAFAELTAGRCLSERSSRLLEGLVDAGLAVGLAGGHHVLPTRLSRWPIPFSAV